MNEEFSIDDFVKPQTIEIENVAKIGIEELKEVLSIVIGNVIWDDKRILLYLLAFYNMSIAVSNANQESLKHFLNISASAIEFSSQDLYELEDVFNSVYNELNDEDDNEF